MEGAKCEQFEKECLSLNTAGGVRSLTLEYRLVPSAWPRQTLFPVLNTVCSTHSDRERVVVITPASVVRQIK